jgi:hypothetical protein
MSSVGDMNKSSGRTICNSISLGCGNIVFHLTHILMLQVLQQLDFSENILSSGWRPERLWYFLHCNILLSYLIPWGAGVEACVSDSQPPYFCMRKWTVETNHTIPETPIFKTLGLVYLSYRQISRWATASVMAYVPIWRFKIATGNSISDKLGHGVNGERVNT